MPLAYQEGRISDTRRTELKRIYSEGTNMAVEFRASELRNTRDRYIASVTFPDRWQVITNESICKLGRHVRDLASSTPIQPASVD